jgi:hypothetical protein
MRAGGGGAASPRRASPSARTYIVWCVCVCGIGRNGYCRRRTTMNKGRVSGRAWSGRRKAMQACCLVGKVKMADGQDSQGNSLELQKRKKKGRNAGKSRRRKARAEQSSDGDGGGGRAGRAVRPVFPARAVQNRLCAPPHANPTVTVLWLWARRPFQKRIGGPAADTFLRKCACLHQATAAHPSSTSLLVTIPRSKFYPL